MQNRPVCSLHAAAANQRSHRA